jgi:hypothetical protein
VSRVTASETTELHAECLRCTWKTTAANGLGNAARHHDATGHAVRTEVTRLIVYGDPAAVPEGQAELFPEGTSPGGIAGAVLDGSYDSGQGV